MRARPRAGAVFAYRRHRRDHPRPPLDGSGWYRREVSVFFVPSPKRLLFERFQLTLTPLLSPRKLWARIAVPAAWPLFRHSGGATKFAERHHNTAHNYDGSAGLSGLGLWRRQGRCGRLANWIGAIWFFYWGLGFSGGLQGDLSIFISGLDPACQQI